MDFINLFKEKRVIFIRSKINFIKHSLSDVMYYIIQGELKRDIIALTIILIVISLTNILASYCYAIVFKHAINSVSTYLILSALITYGGVKLLLLINTLITDILGKKVKQRLIFRFRHITLQSLFESDYEWMQNNRTGDLIGRIQDNAFNLANNLGEFIPDIIRRSLVAIVSIIALSFINIWLSIVFLIIIIIMLYLQVNGGYYCKRYMDEMQLYKSDRNALYYDLISQEKTVQIFRMNSYIEQWLEIKTNNFIRSLVKAMSMMTLAFSPAIIFNQLSFIIPSAIGSLMAINGAISLQDFITAISLISIASGELKGFDAIFANLPTILSNGIRVKEIWDSPKEIQGTDKNVDFKKDTIVLKDCTFKYKGTDLELLKELNINIKMGEKVAIVGKSGCGKSTLLKILGGIYTDYGGKVEIWGKEIKKYDKSTLYNYVGYVSQDPSFFSDTIYNNLMLFNKENNDEKIKNILNNLSLNNLLEKLHISILESEQNISGGEKQRLSLARTLLKDPKMLLLDEVTSALDSYTDEKINKYILAFSDMTVISIIHKVYLTKDYDRIIVMDDGKIIEEGKYYDLLDKKGIFYNMIMEMD